ncbi:MAG TPA: hypothetical protein PK930_14220 [Leptospiraceae bacterium]|nr:hypothetical protein [Leptospiraceae bacterium]
MNFSYSLFKKFVLLTFFLLFYTNCEFYKAYKYNEEGIQHLSESNYEDSKTSFHKSISYSYKTYIPTYNIGNTLIKEDDFPSAHEKFQQAIEANPEFKEAIYNDGQVLYLWGKKELAPETCDVERARVLFEQAMNRFKEVVDLPNAGDYKKAAGENSQYIESELTKLDELQENKCQQSQDQSKQDQNKSDSDQQDQDSENADQQLADNSGNPQDQKNQNQKTDKTQDSKDSKNSNKKEGGDKNEKDSKNKEDKGKDSKEKGNTGKDGKESKDKGTNDKEDKNSNGKNGKDSKDKGNTGKDGKENGNNGEDRNGQKDKGDNGKEGNDSKDGNELGEDDKDGGGGGYLPADEGGPRKPVLTPDEQKRLGKEMERIQKRSGENKNHRRSRHQQDKTNKNQEELEQGLRDALW